jgi:DNA polymerase III delta subunit
MKIKLMDLIKMMSNESFPHFMVWFGEEQLVLDKYLDHLVDIGYTRYEYETVAEVNRVCRKKNLTATKNLYVVSSDQDFMKAEKSWRQMEQTFSKLNHVLIFRTTKINKITKFFKQNQTVEFEKLTPEVLQKYIITGDDQIDLDDPNAKKLIQICNNDYGRILLEMDKINNLRAVKNITGNDAFKLLYHSGQITNGQESDNTFDFINAVVAGYPDRAGKLLNGIKQKNESVFGIESLLFSSFTNVLAYKGLGKDKSNAEQRTGLTKGQLYGAKKNIGGYSIKELVRNIGICQSVESGIKAGRLDADLALDYMLVNCMR